MMPTNEQELAAGTFEYIEAKRFPAMPEPLLTDNQVVVIRLRRTTKPKRGPSESAEGGLVRTAEGLSTDARMLATQIGLAKAMRKYDLRELHHVPLVGDEGRAVRRCHSARFLAGSDPAPDVIRSSAFRRHKTATTA